MTTISIRLGARKIWFGLLLLLIFLQMIFILYSQHSTDHLLLFSSQNSTLIRFIKHPSCLPFDPQITPKHLFQTHFSVLDDSKWRSKPSSFSPSFEQLHTMLFGSTARNLYAAWPNHQKKTLDLTYPFTSLTPELFTDIIKQVKIPIRFIVEVGSFTGKSSINIVRSMRRINQTNKFVLLCIDTWLGGLEYWTSENMREMMGFAKGRPIVYETFLANIIGNNLTDYVLPFSTTSILGARFLLDRKFFPQIIFLDSAHLQGETYIELELYWLLLQPGGVLIGDDWRWLSVRCDVLRFTYNKNVKLVHFDHIWFIKKIEAF